jgi:hypothetical protein
MALPDESVSLPAPAGSHNARFQAKLKETAAFASTLVGLPAAEAEARGVGSGFFVEVLRQGVATCDYRSDRIRLRVDDDDVVTESHAG